MADKTIGELPVASKLYDDSLLVLEQQGEACSIAGALIRQFVDETAKPHVEHAETSAGRAGASAEAAAGSARDAADVALHPPILTDENDHWWVWDTGLNGYTDSGIDAGVSLEVVEEIITGEPGTPASVANRGTKTDPVLQFTIPEGKKGNKGDAATIEVGKVITGEPGSAAKVENSGTPGAAKLDFVIPQGPTGRGFTILGYYDTADELKAAVLDPAAGDAYGVGEIEPYDIYIYDGNTNEWVNSGPINVDLPPHLIVGEDSDLETVLPVNADTLGGHQADYFASDAEMAERLEKKQDALPYYTNRNLLDDWYFVGGGSQQGSGHFPINQKAQKEYDVTSLISQYTIDRWSTTFSSLSLEDDCILITSTNTPSCSFAQYLECPESYAGKTVTLSALFKEVSGTVQLTINPNSQTVPAKFDFVTEPGLASCTWTIPEDVQGFLYAGINIFQGGTARVIAIKLELGTRQTLAHQENGVWVLNEVPDYGTELAKCLRYFYHFTTQLPPGNGFVDSLSQACIEISLPVPLRATPTVTFGANTQLISNGKSITVDADPFIFLTQSGICVIVNIADKLSDMPIFSSFTVYFTVGFTIDANL